MQRVVQTMSLLMCSMLLENMMKVMGQKELGYVMKISAWAIATAWILEIMAKAFMWVESKLMLLERIFGG